MFFDDVLADEFGSLDPSLIDDDLMMFAQLYLIIFNGLVQGLIFVASLFNIMNDLKEIDGDREDLSACL